MCGRGVHSGVVEHKMSVLSVQRDTLNCRPHARYQGMLDRVDVLR